MEQFKGPLMNNMYQHLYYRVPGDIYRKMVEIVLDEIMTENILSSKKETDIQAYKKHRGYQTR